MTTFWSENGYAYELPQKEVKRFTRFKVTNKKQLKEVKLKFERIFSINPDEVFSDINQKYTKAGALLKGLRHREGMNQNDFAKKLEIKQGDLSKMENGKRPIGKAMARRIQKKFKVDYRWFL